MNGWRKNDASPEVERSQAEADSRVWNLNGSIHHLHLALLHRARQPRLPADHKLTRGFVGTAGRATIGTLALKAALNFNHFFHTSFSRNLQRSRKNGLENVGVTSTILEMTDCYIAPPVNVLCDADAGQLLTLKTNTQSDIN